MSDACTVRALTEDDLPMVLAWRNHPEIRRFMFTQHEITLSEHLQWFENVTHDNSRRLLVVQEHCIPIGYVQLSKVQRNGTADWGFYVRPNAAKGTGYKLGRSVLKYAFLELQLNKVCGQAIATNHSSIRFHERLGFNREALHVDHFHRGSNGANIIFFGILACQWLGLKD